MLPPQKEVPRRIPRVGVQVVTHRRVMVVPIRGLGREVVVMVHRRTRLATGNVGRRGPTRCPGRRHGSSRCDLVTS